MSLPGRMRMRSNDAEEMMTTLRTSSKGPCCESGKFVAVMGNNTPLPWMVNNQKVMSSSERFYRRLFFPVPLKGFHSPAIHNYALTTPKRANVAPRMIAGTEYCTIASTPTSRIPRSDPIFHSLLVRYYPRRFRPPELSGSSTTTIS